MKFKKKLGAGVVTAALGLGLISGGTYAYFSDTEVTNSTFAAGTLDLSVNPTTIVDVDNIKPGDTMLREFKISNGGTLDIKKVDLLTDYTVLDAKGDNGNEDFGDHIRVNFLVNESQVTAPIFSTTLSELKNLSPEAIQTNWWTHFIGNNGLKAGKSHKFYVQFEFVDNGEDQNIFQGDKLQLEWTFNGMQTDGEAR